MVAVSEIDLFLARTQFDSYQSVPLPFGRATPGKDLGSRADLILGDRVRGKSVLDIGTYYGYFPYAAMQRGARAAVGVESHPDRFAIASRISTLNGGGYTITRSRAEEFDSPESFDVVLCLNVLHHLVDPIGTIVRLAGLCSGSLILEFPTLKDHFFLHRAASSGREVGHRTRAARKLRAGALAVAVRSLDRHVALIGLGEDPGRTFHFSRAAFERTFLHHLQVFSRVEYLNSPRSARPIVVCAIAAHDIAPQVRQDASSSPGAVPGYALPAVYGPRGHR